MARFDPGYFSRRITESDQRQAKHCPKQATKSLPVEQRETGPWFVRCIALLYRIFLDQAILE
jgi:hypothetical protein